MGKLDFSVIDKRVKKRVNRNEFGGFLEKFNYDVSVLKKNNTPYRIQRDGSIGYLHYGNLIKKYILISRGCFKGTYDETVLCACKDVKREAKAFIATGKKLDYGIGETYFTNNLFTSEYVLSGGTDVSLVDINHCYWRIAFLDGIITEKTYLKYINEKDARLVAIGNLNKTKMYEYSDGGGNVTAWVESQETAWLWDYIVYRAYKIVNEVKESLGGKIFSYITDGIYMPPEYCERAMLVLKGLDMNSKIENYKIVGSYGHYIVLENQSNGLWKRANLGTGQAISKSLKQISKEDFNENCK